MPTYRVICTVCGNHEKRLTASERPTRYVCTVCTAIWPEWAPQRAQAGRDRAAARKLPPGGAA